MQSQIEGKNPVLEALRSGRALNKILISNNMERSGSVAEILHLSKTRRVPVEWVPSDILKRKSRAGSPQGIIAYTSAKEYVDIYDLLEITKSKNCPAFYIMLDGLEDPHNLGAIIRTADAAGVHGLIVPERRAVPLTDTVAKVSAGAIEYVPVARVTNLNNTIKILKENNIWVIGLEHKCGKLLYEMDLKLPIALIIGGEGKGISRLVKENCDEVVSIPSMGKVSSLNASVAASVAMYEVLRQRMQ